MVTDEPNSARNEFSGSAEHVVQAGRIDQVHVHVGGASPLDQAARELRRVVAAQWREEASERRLFTPVPLRVRWEPRESDGPPLHGDDPVELAAAFRAVPRRRLVVLGEPGAGKTTLALLLVLALLRDARESDPVPVLLSLRDWAPGREHLRAWLIRRLLEDYPGLRAHDAARRLVTAHRVLPVLDGLDELPPAVRPKALGELNRALGGDAPLVVTSRTDDYDAAAGDAGQVLTAATVVEARPLDLAVVDHYLPASASPRRAAQWQPVLDALRAEPNGPLGQAMGSPLTVWLARTVYANSADDPAELLDFTDRAALEEHLANALIPAVYAPGPAPPSAAGEAPALPPPRYSPDRARRRLTYLARHTGDMAHYGGLIHVSKKRAGEIAWWRLIDAIPPVLLLAMLVGAGVLGTVALGIPYPEFGWPENVVFGLVAGVLSVLLAVADDTPPMRHRSTLRAWLHFRRLSGPLAVMLLVLAALVVASEVSGVVLSLETVDVNRNGVPSRDIRFRPPGNELTWAHLPAVLRYVLAPFVALWFAMTAAGLGSNFISSETPHLVVDLSEDAPTPVALLRADRRNTLVKLVRCFVVVELAACLCAVAPMDWDSLLALLRLGAFVGCLVTLWVLFFRTAWGRWVFARTALAAVGLVPWRLLGFLEDARQRGVLRQTGGVYEFRHTRLLDALDGQDRPTPEPPRSQPPSDPGYYGMGGPHPY
jgi:hypothetical protein